PDELEKYRDFFDVQRLIQCYQNGELEQTYDTWVTDPLGQKRLSHYVILLGSNKYNGDIVALIMTKDFTEQMKRQRLLQNSLRQAQAAWSAKSAFLANISHDVRTPLNAILGLTDLIQLHIDDPEKIKGYLDNIRLSGKQLLTIVNESLEVTRTESGKASLAETECHLADLLADTQKAMLPAMLARSLHFTVDDSSVKHFEVCADAVRIQEILCQLLDNAAKYTEPGGTVTLTVSEEQAKGEYGKYSFTVEDNGIGISEEFMEHLFEPFAREQNTTKSRVPGSGLGMAVVKSLVDIMQGKTEVKSIVGKGTRITVSVLLRHLNKSLSAKTELSVPDISLCGKRILLVEDNEINLEIEMELLEDAGFLVDAEENGSIAVEKIQASQPGDYSLIV
ncbi:MAG: hybrid sensor histidine kinase/response regulator, partial [Lachnospiraceae bacterium]|nr:hybrid sensor histidine kinase/response regulator [Lachnospiraceae bacterium]